MAWRDWDRRVQAAKAEAHRMGRPVRLSAAPVHGRSGVTSLNVDDLRIRDYVSAGATRRDVGAAAVARFGGPAAEVLNQTVACIASCAKDSSKREGEAVRSRGCWMTSMSVLRIRRAVGCASPCAYIKIPLVTSSAVQYPSIW